jgi:hypothetical protein
VASLQTTCCTTKYRSILYTKPYFLHYLLQAFLHANSLSSTPPSIQYHSNILLTSFYHSDMVTAFKTRTSFEENLVGIIYDSISQIRIQLTVAVRISRSLHREPYYILPRIYGRWWRTHEILLELGASPLEPTLHRGLGRVFRRSNGRTFIADIQLMNNILFSHYNLVKMTQAQNGLLNKFTQKRSKPSRTNKNVFALLYLATLAFSKRYLMLYEI